MNEPKESNTMKTRPTSQKWLACSTTTYRHLFLAALCWSPPPPPHISLPHVQEREREREREKQNATERGVEVGDVLVYIDMFDI